MFRSEPCWSFLCQLSDSSIFFPRRPSLYVMIPVLTLDTFLTTYKTTKPFFFKISMSIFGEGET